MSKTYLLHGQHVSRKEFTKAVLDTLLQISRKHPGDVLFGQTNILHAMFYAQKEKEGDIPYNPANPQQIKSVLDDEAKKGDKERRVNAVSIPFEYNKNNFNGSEPLRRTDYYRMRSEYTINLRKTGGPNGEFPCPNESCGKLISPDDLTSNKIVETVYRGKVQEEGIEKIIVSCSNCKSKTEIIGLK